MAKVLKTGMPGPTRGPRLIFPNVMNEANLGAPAAAMGRIDHPVSAREVWLAEEGDVIVTPSPVSEAFRRYVGDVLDIDIHTVRFLCPGARADELLTTAVRRAGLERELREAVAERGVRDAIVNGQDRPTLALTSELGVSLDGYRDPPGPEVLRAVYEMNTKSGFQKIGRELGLPVVEGRPCQGVEDLHERVLEMLGGGPRTALVKFDRSNGGYGHLYLSRAVEPAALREILVSHLGAYLEQPASFMVEPLLSIVHQPSAEMRVTGDGPEALYLCDQRCQGGIFSGLLTPPRGLPEDVAFEMVDAAKRFGAHLHALGYRGSYDVDGCVTREGEVVLTEANVRRTGGTYLDALARRLVGGDYVDTHVLLADSRPSCGSRGDFSAACLAVNSAGLAFERRAGHGVILTADTVEADGHWRYMILARDDKHAVSLETELASVLDLAPLSS